MSSIYKTLNRYGKPLSSEDEAEGENKGTGVVATYWIEVENPQIHKGHFREEKFKKMGDKWQGIFKPYKNTPEGRKAYAQEVFRRNVPIGRRFKLMRAPVKGEKKGFKMCCLGRLISPIEVDIINPCRPSTWGRGFGPVIPNTPPEGQVYFQTPGYTKHLEEERPHPWLKLPHHRVPKAGYHESIIRRYGFNPVWNMLTGDNLTRRKAWRGRDANA